MSNFDNDNWTMQSYVMDIVFVRHAQSYNNCLGELINNECGSISEDDYKKEEILRRQQDAELSETGYEQVDHLKQYLKNGGWNDLIPQEQNDSWIVYSSPMNRTLITASAVAEGLDKDVVVDHELYENGGCYEALADGTTVSRPGKSERDVLSEYPRYKCLPGMEQGWYSKFNKKESDSVFIERCHHVSAKLWKMFHENIQLQQANRAAEHLSCGKMNKPIKGLVIVAHANFIGGLLNCLMTQQKTGRNCMFVCNNTGVTHIQLHHELRRNQKTVAICRFNDTRHLKENRLVTGGDPTGDRHIHLFFGDHD